MKKSKKSQKTRILEIVYCGVAIALIAICSWITIPTQVPFTLQTFAVFTALGILGGRLGTISTAVYILLGAIGVPVFSGMKGGIGHLLNQTGGYIIGFILMALLYWLFEKLPGDKLWIKIIAMIIGLAICYAFGTAWFMYVYIKSNGAVALSTVLGWCVFPFILPDAAKMVAAIAISAAVKEFVKYK